MGGIFSGSLGTLAESTGAVTWMLSWDLHPQDEWEQEEVLDSQLFFPKPLFLPPAFHIISPVQFQLSLSQLDTLILTSSKSSDLAGFLHSGRTRLSLPRIAFSLVFPKFQASRPRDFVF